MKKKLLALVLSVMCVASLVACGGGAASSAAEAPAESKEEAAPAESKEEAAPAESKEEAAPAESKEEAAAEPAGDKIVIQVGYENNPSEPLHTGCEAWKAKLDEISDGSISIELYPSAQLGKKVDALDMMQMGEPVAYITDCSFLADYGAPELSVMSAPYMFTSWEQLHTLVESDWFKSQEELLAQNNIHIITKHMEYGLRQLMTVKPVRTIDDLKGMIIRTPQNTVQLKTFEYLGAAPTGMDLSEVYTNTQTGAIEGMENPIPTLYGQSYWEVAKYLTKTSHLYMIGQFVMSNDVWNGLTEQQQKWLSESADYGMEVFNKEAQNLIDSEIAEMEEKGVEVIELDDAELQKFIDASVGLFSDPEVAGNWREGLRDIVIKASGQ